MSTIPSTILTNVVPNGLPSDLSSTSGNVPAADSVQPGSASGRAGQAALAAGPTGAASSPEADLPNPRLTVAPGTNRVVLQFFDSSGTLTNSIPSQQQLDAYRLAAAAGLPTGAGSPEV